MNIVEIIFLGIALSMDACAVSVTDGMCIRKIKVVDVFAIALTFGIYQAFMPLAGFLGASLFSKQICAIDHWIALILLGFLGIRMIVEGVQELRKNFCIKKGITAPEQDVCEVSGGKITFKLLMLQGLATSIDALAVGISLAAVSADIIESSVLIGLTTTVLCIPSVLVGKKSGDFLSDKAQILGGCILVAIGVKIFVQHVFFGG